MEKNSRNIIIGLIIALLISFSFNVYYNVTDKEQKVVEKVTTVIKMDTIKDTVPQVKYVKYISTIHDTLNHLEIVHDTLVDGEVIEKIDTIPTEVEIPITQQTYSDDSTYTAWVSGYKQKLDSISVYRKNTIVTKEITITKKDNHRFGVGPVIYGGYDFGGKRFGWGIGIGVTYNIFRW